MAALNLATSSALHLSAVVHLDALRPGPLPERSGFSPLTDALRPPRAGRLPPPARRAAATQRVSVSRSARHARRSCRSRTRHCPALKRTVRSPLTAVKVIDQQNVYLLRRTPPVSLTGLALAHRPSQFKPRRLQQHRKARPCKPALAAAY